jgi:hypothetical protein
MDTTSLRVATRSMAGELTRQAFWMGKELKRIEPLCQRTPELVAEHAEARRRVDESFGHFHFDGQDELEWMDRMDLLLLEPDAQVASLRQHLARFLRWMDAALRPPATFAQQVGPDGTGTLTGMVVYTGVGEMLRARQAWCDQVALIGITANGLDPE